MHAIIYDYTLPSWPTRTDARSHIKSSATDPLEEMSMVERLSGSIIVNAHEAPELRAWRNLSD